LQEYITKNITLQQENRKRRLGMIIISEEGFAELEIKKSKFISYAVHIDEFKKKLEILKKNHPKARHIVWAYKKIDSNGNIELKSTDDGEPKGTAGKPTLNVLGYSDVQDAAILTVRYFGGILLGTGGLVKAYSDAANLALKNSKLVDTYEIYAETIVVPFEKSQNIFYLIDKYNIKIVEQNYGEKGIIIKVMGNKKFIEELKEHL